MASARAPAAEKRRIVLGTAERVASVRGALPPRFLAMAEVGDGLGLRQGEVLGLSPADSRAKLP